MEHTLTLLPIEVLSLIVELIDGIHIARLWLCGSKSLNWKLGNGGAVKNFVFNLGRRSRWPYLVSSFSQLQRFSLCNKKKLVGNINKLDWASLPRSVTSIRSIARHDVKTFSKAVLADPSLFSNLRSLKLGSREYYKLDFDEQAKNMPNLTSLCFDFMNVVTLHFSSLPPSLTRLKCKLDDASFKGTTLSLDEAPQSWPFELRDLNLRLGSSAHLSPFFPSIKHSNVARIKLEVLSLLLPYKWDWGVFPTTLKSLTVLGSPRISASELRLLPRNLETFKATFNVPLDDKSSLLEAISSLPPSLTSLSENITSTIYDEDLLAQICAALPRSLTHCESLAVPPRIVPVLPPNFKSLNISIRNTSDLSPLSGHLLQLERLHLQKPRYLLEEGVMDRSELLNLPKDLRQLRIISQIAFSARDSFTMLPRNLTSLSLSHLGGSPGTECLPPGLLHLWIERVPKLPSHFFANLPPSLTSISLNFGNYCPNPSEFSAPQCCVLKVARFNFKSPKIVVAPILRFLPRSIIHLSLSQWKCEDTGINGGNLCDLPPNLESLEVSHSKGLHAGCAPKFPKSLVSFRFTSDGTPEWWKSFIDGDRTQM